MIAAARCFEDEEALRLLDGRMGSDERRARLPHLDGCPPCYDRILDLLYDSLPDDPNDVPERRQVDQYLLGEELRHGNYWWMMRARDETTGREVALRMMSIMATAEGYDDVARQQGMLMRLSHEHVASVSSLSIEFDSLYSTMELLGGHALEQWLTEEPRSWRAIATACLPPLEAMLDAHRQGFVLQGFLPQNILVRDDGLAVLANFGDHIWGRSWIDAQHGVDAGYFVKRLRPVEPTRPVTRDDALASEVREAATTLHWAFHGRSPFDRRAESPTKWPVGTPPPVEVQEMLMAVLHRASSSSAPDLGTMIRTLRRSLERPARTTSER